MNKIPGQIIARGGSVRLPRKNVKDFCGKPLIAWTVISMVQAKLIDDVFMVTDDDEIAEIAVSYGANIIRQPTCQCQYGQWGGNVAELWFILKLREMGYRFDIHASRLPTCLLSGPKDFDNAIQIMLDRQADAVTSVIDMHGLVLSKAFPVDLHWDWLQWVSDWTHDTYYANNGALGVTKTEAVIKYKLSGLIIDGKMKPEIADGTADLSKSEYNMNHGVFQVVIPYKMPRWTLFPDIDTQDDWDNMEVLFKLHKKELFGDEYED